METLQQLLDSSTAPVITAFLLGLLTAISPCHRLHDGHRGPFAARDDDAEEGDELEAHRHLLRHHRRHVHPQRMAVQRGAVKVRILAFP